LNEPPTDGRASGHRPRLALSPLAAALVLTLLIAVKPMHIDDTAYYYYAAQIAEHPLDPYGFEVFWGQRPQPANHTLAPPVLPYWWAAGIRLFGQRPFFWRLWLFPFCLLLTGSLYALGRRFAPGLEAPLVWMTVLSPAVLPSTNLMLDVPALALGLGALVTLMAACDRHSWLLASVAGLIAGLAMQTKYTGCVALAAMLAYAALTKRIALGLLVLVPAVAVFVSWEGFVALRYGESHFLHGLLLADKIIVDKLLLVPGFVTLLGGVAPAVALLGLVALGADRRQVMAAAAVTACGLILLAVAPASTSVGPDLSVVLFCVFGAAVCLVLTNVARRASRPWGSAERFLLLWAVMELVGYLALSPYPAVRRLLEFLVVATLLVGRLASGSVQSHAQRALVRATAAGGVVLGLFYYGLDLGEALAQRDAAEEAARRVHGRSTDATAWYVGHWGFQFYAERAGLRPVVPLPQGRTSGEARATASVLRKGDWLIVPGHDIAQQSIRLADGSYELVDVLNLGSWLPLRTVPDYYAGLVPLRQGRQRVAVKIILITADAVQAETCLDEAQAL
jgi:hypothetical protein